jgi:CDGSH-type Zn-finger protein
MARLVRLERTGPYKIEAADFPKDGKPMWICGCGLSSTMPYCDKAHKTCVNERPGTLYVYDPATRLVVEQRPDPGASAQP